MANQSNQSNSVFLSTYSLQEFKALKNVTTIKRLRGRGAGEGLMFFSFGPSNEDRGIISSKLVESGDYSNVCVSLVKDLSSNNLGWVMHRNSEDEVLDGEM